ncbi:MAG: DUF3881 family protein [Lachnospiraceae bacterium]|nr:DUF3881 family protein [Lachnospiraceae bacterium]
MHDFLRAVGFRSVRTKAQLKKIVDWVLEQPDQMSIVSSDHESNLVQASREVANRAGITVIGELSERGDVIPEYYFPYVSSTHISSDARITYEHQSAKTGYIGMCEDYRLGMALIFTVRNVTEVYRNAQGFPAEPDFSRVAFSALAKDGTVLLPLQQSARVLKQEREMGLSREQLLEDAHMGDPKAMERLAKQEMDRYDRVIKRIRETDVFTLVNSFFMPHGMESDQYYFMGKILSKQLLENHLTQERFYRMIVESNGMELTVSINEEDLTGTPEVGCRIKCHAWLIGELKH